MKNWNPLQKKNNNPGGDDDIRVGKKTHPKWYSNMKSRWHSPYELFCFSGPFPNIPFVICAIDSGDRATCATLIHSTIEEWSGSCGRKNPTWLTLAFDDMNDGKKLDTYYWLQLNKQNASKKPSENATLEVKIIWRRINKWKQKTLSSNWLVS